MMICSVAKNFVTFLIAFGLFGGLGAGMLFLPPLVLIGHFFRSKLALATSIARMGSPCGGCVLAPLASLLIQLLGWHYAFFVLCCITFLVPIACMFLRAEPDKMEQANDLGRLSRSQSSLNTRTMIQEGQPKSAYMGIPLQSLADNAPREPPPEPKSLFMLFPFQNLIMNIATDVGKEEEKAKGLITLKDWDPTSGQSFIEFALSLTLPWAKTFTENCEKSKTRISMLMEEASVSICLPDLNPELKETLSEPFLKGQQRLSSYLDQYEIQFNPEVKDNMMKQIKSGHESFRNLFRESWIGTSLSNSEQEAFRENEEAKSESGTNPAGNDSPIPTLFSIGRLPIRRSMTEPKSDPSNEFQMIQKSDDFHRPSPSIPRTNTNPNDMPKRRIEGVVYRDKSRARTLRKQSNVSPPPIYRCSGPRSSLKDIIVDIRKQSLAQPSQPPQSNWSKLKSCFALDMICNSSFMFFCLANAIGNASSFIPLVYLHEFMFLYSFTSTQCSIVIALIQVLNAAGRVPLGWIVDMSCMSPIIVSAILWAVSGGALFLLTFCQTYWAFLCLGMLFGLGNAVLSIQSVVLIDILSLSQLPKALGVLLFCEGLAKIIIPPLAGFLATEYQNHNVIFYFSSFGFLFSCVSCFLSYVVQQIRVFRKTQSSAVHV
ncbi:uncharacterized protein LOC131879851 [Tigriopus californicus]|nr:uncharacterized protein LOC131879851 [Tigriopus californicus]